MQVLLCAVVCSAQNGRKRRPPNRDGDQQYTRDPDHTHPPRPADHTRGTADAEDYTRPTRGAGNGGRPGKPEGPRQRPNRGKREAESDTNSDSDSDELKHARPTRGTNDGQTRPAPSTDDGQTRGPRPRQPGNGGRPQRRLLSSKFLFIA